MDTIQEKALIKYYRRVLARVIKREREIFRKGLDAINAMSDWEYKYIKASSECYAFRGELTPENLLSFRDSIQKTLPRNSTPLKMEVDLEDEKPYDYFGCSDCGRTDQQGFIVFTARIYTLPTLENFKRSVLGSIKNWLSDASFKLVMQPKGKDTKRYLANIEKGKLLKWRE